MFPMFPKKTIPDELSSGIVIYTILLVLALSCCLSLLLALYAGLFIALSLAKLR